MYRLYDKSRGSRSRWIGYRVPIALGLSILVGVAAVAFGSLRPNNTDLTATNGNNQGQSSVAPMPDQAKEAASVGICAKTTVPFKTVYNDSAQMYVGESKETGGVDGWIQTCKPDSNGNKPADENVAPVNKIVTLGTLPRPVQAEAKKNTTPKNTCTQNVFQKIFNFRC